MIEEIIIGMTIIFAFAYFSLKYGWFGKPRCAYCGERVRKYSDFCSDDCRKQYFGEK